jgi:transposase
MIPLPSGVRVWIAAGHCDMRRGMQGLARQVQEVLQRDPHVAATSSSSAVAAAHW